MRTLFLSLILLPKLAFGQDVDSASYKRVDLLSLRMEKYMQQHTVARCIELGGATVSMIGLWQLNSNLTQHANSYSSGSPYKIPTTLYFGPSLTVIGILVDIWAADYGIKMMGEFRDGKYVIPFKFKKDGRTGSND
jgi:hypothetical protein